MGSRYQYDVNKTTRYIDIHKQFQGGLKTVDTDDSLKDIFLREAENVSLSEFGFLEKRYGLHKNGEEAPWNSIESADSKLQGYFEYYVDADTVDKIIVFEGRFYVNRDGNGFEEVELFDTPTGEAIDLSSLGVYTYQDIESVTLSSYVDFSNQAPVFFEDVSSMNAVTSYAIGTIAYVYSVSSHYEWVGSINGGWEAIQGSEGEGTYPASFIENKYYKDDRTDRIYQWENATGKTGQLTLVTSIYAADIQSTRPVEGVRIDDKLYIATGTYPVYYKGDGKIYVFEPYQMSDLDLENLSYDLNAINIADFFAVPTAPVNGYKGTDVAGAQLIEIREVHKNYRVGHTNSTPAFKISVDFGLADNATLDEWSTGSYDFDSSVTNPYGTWSDGDPTSGGWVRKAELILKVYVKNSGELPSLYEELPGMVYNSSERNNKYSNDQSASINGYLQQAINNIPVLTATFPSLTSGVYDFKVELSFVETGWLYSDDEGGTVGSRILKQQSFEITNFTVYAEELEDYLEDPIAGLEGAVHTCNRITQHYGRLVLWGNPSHPTKIFFSTVGAKNYFPYFYMIDFTNDLQEGVNAITRFQNILVVQSDSYTWGLKGSVPLLLDPLEGTQMEKITINPTIGCIAPNSVKNIRNQLFFLSKEGVFSLRTLFAEDLRYNVDPIDRNIYNIVPRDSDAICAYYDDQYWLHFPQRAMTLRYYVEKKAWVKDVYSAWNIFGGIFKYINESGVLRFITHLSQFEDNDDYKIFDVVVDYALPTDLTKNVSSKFTTSYLNQNYPFHPKNYKEAKFEFTVQNEYNMSREPILPILNSGVENSTYVQFDASLLNRHQYSLTFDPTEVSAGASYSIYLDGAVSAIATGTISATGANLNPITFVSNRTGNVTVKISVTNTIADAEDLVLYDSTYDNSITFINAVLSEEGTLNIDPINSYDQAEVEKTINLGTRLGNWVFGTSDFGNVITAVQTIKLSGRGYNCKINVQEYGKSKWTLESVGITYKVKKARSR